MADLVLEKDIDANDLFSLERTVAFVYAATHLLLTTVAITKESTVKCLTLMYTVIDPLLTGIILGVMAITLKCTGKIYKTYIVLLSDCIILTKFMIGVMDKYFHEEYQ